jgi:hypothetical protein
MSNKDSVFSGEMSINHFVVHCLLRVLEKNGIHVRRDWIEEMGRAADMARQSGHQQLAEHLAFVVQQHRTIEAYEQLLDDENTTSKQ